MWTALFVLAAFLLARTRLPLRSTTVYLNAFGAVLVAIAAITALFRLSADLGQPSSRPWREIVMEENAQTRLRPVGPARDIYYIILDAYARGDTFSDCMGFDNSSFISFLRSRGFYVADRATSNYGSTAASLPSQLNMDYIQSMSRQMGCVPNEADLTAAVADSRVCHLLKGAGYRFIFVPSIYQITRENPNADVVIDTDRFHLSKFERFLAKRTMLSLVLATSRVRRQRLLSKLEQLEDIPLMEGPKFVFVHILCPHVPYLFDSDVPVPGLSLNSSTPDNIESRRYVGQTAYINTRMRQVIDVILKRSEVRPIIILQGDHGTHAKPLVTPHVASTLTPAQLVDVIDCAPLAAFCFPGDGEKKLYPSVSHVNSFRILFNTYFGARYQLLRDRSYSVKPSPTKRYKRFTLLPNPAASLARPAKPLPKIP